MLNVVGLSHACINVDDINEGIAYYAQLLSAEPLQIFPHFKNEGFSVDAGFNETCEVSIAFLALPKGAMTLELMQYHSPKGQVLDFDLSTTDRGRVGHIALKVEDIDGCLAHIRSVPDTRVIGDAPTFKPVLISRIGPDAFRLLNAEAEADAPQKQVVADIISSTRFFYFVDRYGIQWECEEGHTDIGTPTG